MRLSCGGEAFGYERIGVGRCYRIVQKGVLVAQVAMLGVAGEVSAEARLVGYGVEIVVASGIEVAKAHGVAGGIVRHIKLAVEAHFAALPVGHDDAQVLHAFALQQVRVGIVAGRTGGKGERHTGLVAGREAVFLDAGVQTAGQQQKRRAGVFQ